MAVLGFNFNLKDQLVFYGAYHSNVYNQIIHFVFVPLIMWTVCVWLSYTPPICECDWMSSEGAMKYFEPNMAMLLVTAYAAYYMTLDLLAGFSWGLCVGVPMWWTAEMFRDVVESAWMWAILVHVGSWVVQVWVGHVLFEKRKPSLMDSFFQSLVLAPLFVWFELLFLLGYKSQLRQDLTAAINHEKSRNSSSGSGKQPLLQGEDES